MKMNKNRGFTLIELLVVMAIIATLLTLAMPRYFHSVDRSKEVVLKENLAEVRRSLDKFYGDNSKYPDTLDELVSKRYLRTLPYDPITQSSSTWEIIPPQDVGFGAVFDIHSGAPGYAMDGTSYRDW